MTTDHTDNVVSIEARKMAKDAATMAELATWFVENDVAPEAALAAAFWWGSRGADQKRVRLAHAILDQFLQAVADELAELRRPDVGNTEEGPPTTPTNPIDDDKPFVVSYMEALASTEDLSELADRWPPLVKIKHDLDARLPYGKVLKAVMLSHEQAVALVEYIRRLKQLAQKDPIGRQPP